MRLISYFSILSIAIFSIAQEPKNEKESRLKKDEVPISIVENLQPYLSKKTRYYREVDNEKKSYEVKLVYLEKKYSIEFSDSLELEDIELTIPLKEVVEQVISPIRSHLSSFKNFKILKIQKQFSSQKLSDKEVIQRALEEQSGDIIKYEVELGIKEKGKWEFFEMTFTQEGEFISKREILERSSDYVLY